MGRQRKFCGTSLMFLVSYSCPNNTCFCHQQGKLLCSVLSAVDMALDDNPWGRNLNLWVIQRTMSKWRDLTGAQLLYCPCIQNSVKSVFCTRWDIIVHAACGLTSEFFCLWVNLYFKCTKEGNYLYKQWQKEVVLSLLYKFGVFF